jgi:hypothetical protein
MTTDISLNDAEQDSRELNTSGFNKHGYSYTSRETFKNNKQKLDNVGKLAQENSNVMEKMKETNIDQFSFSRKTFFGIRFQKIVVVHKPDISDLRSYLKFKSLEIVHYQGSGVRIEWKPAVGSPVFAYGISGVHVKNPRTVGILVSRAKK